MPNFDFHKNCWYIQVNSVEESLAAIKFLKTKGYEFESDSAMAAIDSFKVLTNFYDATNKPHNYLLYGTREASSRSWIDREFEINLKFEYSVGSYVVEPDNKTLKQISDLEEQVKLLNDQIASLKNSIITYKD